MDRKADCDVIIIGAGLAGLSAAIHCEQRGYDVRILEGTDCVGGRIKSDIIDGFILDHGFQVLISSYPMAKELLNMKELMLGSFASGALITDDHGSFRIGDPLRDPRMAITMPISRIGSLSDKIKLFALSRKVRRMTPDDVFTGQPMTTIDYLLSAGFSKAIIYNFFIPFFGGIFLERKLHTAAGMFRFVLRNFTLGNACLPAKGMQALPDQLLQKLKPSTLRINAKVKSISNEGDVHLESGEMLSAKKVIVACQHKSLISKNTETSFRQTTTMYFAGSSTLKRMHKTIGLDARIESEINNYSRIDEVAPSYAPKGKSLWSVTLREDSNTSEKAVNKSLSKLIGASEGALTLLKTYHIPQALPVILQPKKDMVAAQSFVGGSIYTAGDHLLNASIEGALRSGIRAGEAVCGGMDS